MRQTLRSHPLDPAATCVALEIWLAARPYLHTIAIYSPLLGEVDLSKTIRALPDRCWLHPRVTGHDLTFHSGENLTPGAFSILEPATGSPEIPLQEIDAFLCPGLAFDKNGGRLGRGRGFYDRMLAQARPNALKIGICFDFQLVPHTFSEAHDIPMNMILAATSIITCDRLREKSHSTSIQMK